MAEAITAVRAKFKAVGSKAVLAEVEAVETSIDRVAAKSRIAASNSHAQAKSEKSLADALRERSEAADQSLKKTEDLFKATDRVAGIMGKVTAAIGIFGLALAGLKAIYESVTGATAKAIEQQKEWQLALKETERRMKALAAAQSGFAAATGLNPLDISTDDRRRGTLLQEEVDRLTEAFERGTLETARAQRELNHFRKRNAQELAELQAKINSGRASSDEVRRAGSLSGASEEGAALEKAVKRAIAIEERLRDRLEDSSGRLTSLVEDIRLRSDVDNPGDIGGGARRGPARPRPGNLAVDAVLNGDGFDISSFFDPSDSEIVADVVREVPDFDSEALLREIGAVDDGFADMVRSISDSVVELGAELNEAGSKISDGVGSAAADMKLFTDGIQTQAVAAAYQLAVMGGSLQETVAMLGIGIGQQAAVKFPITVADALAAEGVTFGIPNPWSKKLWASAGIYGALAIGGGAVGVALGGGRGASSGGAGGLGGPGPRAFAPTSPSAPGNDRSTTINISVETGQLLDTAASVGAAAISAIKATERVMGAPQIPERTIRRGR